jgi:hypothetical protein
MQVLHGLHFFRRIAVASLIFGLTQASLSYGQSRSAEQRGIPNWVSWRVFQDSLAYYDKKSSAETRKMLKARLGLSPAQANKLLTSGSGLLADFDKIDAEAKSESQKRFSVPPTIFSNGNQGNGNQKKELKTLKQLAAQDGLDKEIEAKRQTALARHKDALLKEFGPLELARIEGFIHTSVTPNIKTVKVDPTAPDKTPGFRAGPPPPSSVTHTPEMPPNLSKAAR